MTSFKDDLASDIINVYLSVKFELRKHLKRKRLLMVVALAIVLPLIFYVVPLLFDMDFADTANEFASGNLGFITLLIIISGAIFAGDAISSEFEKKTGLLLFPTPQRRTSIFVGKYIAAIISVWLVVSLYYLITMLEIVQIYSMGGISIELAKSFLIALLYAASVISIIYFFSSILKRTITSTLIGFFTLMMILPIISTVLSAVDVDPWFLVTHSANLIADVLGTSGGGFEPGNGPGGNGFGGGFSPDFYVGIYVMVLYTIGFFLTSIGLANRKEMR
jgi:ABC-2 type transport system permease protein